VDASHDYGDPSLAIGPGDPIGPECGLGGRGNSHQVCGLQIAIEVDGVDKVIPERDFHIGRRKGGHRSKGEVGDRSVVLHCWGNKL
jgi:hypothetical protein